MLPTDSSTRLLELLVLTDQHWAYSKLKAPICLISRTSKEMLTVVRSMMEWLGGTISKEDLGDTGNRNQRRRRPEDEDEALGALALRFKYVWMQGSSWDRLLIQAFSQICRVLLKPWRSNPQILIAHTKTHSCGPCFPFTRPVQRAFLRVLAYLRKRRSPDWEIRTWNIRPISNGSMGRTPGGQSKLARREDRGAYVVEPSNPTGGENLST